MSKRKILVVDDEEMLCKSVKLNLEETDQYEVVTETKGSNALRIAKTYQPDLIILDFIMPDMDGGDVAQQLENDLKTKDIPVIFLTAVATTDDTQDQGALIGGRYVIAKPFTTEKLIQGIEEQF